MRFFVLLAVISSSLLCDAAPFAFNPLAPIQAMANTGIEAGKGVITTGLTGLQAGANVGFNTLSAMGSYLNPMNMIQAGTSALGYGSGSGLQSIGAGLSSVGSGLTGMGTNLNGLTGSLTGASSGFSAFSEATNDAVNSGVAAGTNTATNAAANALTNLESAMTN